MSVAQRVAHVASRDRHTLDVSQSTAPNKEGAPYLGCRRGCRGVKVNRRSMPARIGIAEGQARRPVPPRAHVSLTLYAVFRVLLPPTLWHHYAGSGELPG